MKNQQMKGPEDLAGDGESEKDKDEGIEMDRVAKPWSLAKIFETLEVLRTNECAQI